MRRSALSAVAGALCLILAVVSAWDWVENPVVAAAERVNGQLAVAAGASYVSLRVINAALSVVQEVEVGGSLGVTANAQPLKWLEPVDDTVERVSALIFAVAVLAGVLSLSLGPVATVGLLVLGIGLLGHCGCDAVWRGRRPPRALRRGIDGTVRLGLVLALLLPGAFALGASAGEVLTRADWAAANGRIEQVAEEARALIEPSAAEQDGRGWLSRQRELVEGYAGAAGTFWARADELLNASLTITGIFLLRMIVLPAVLLLGVLAILRRGV